ncbi:O-methyltransferase [Rathayibacter sp. AY1H3]|uniref:O-methyltransferase n=1 Tax=Rathayibacter sp. AY1H3 TaxID=2080567 RepID=UPI000CE777C4|nr:class I SAM-dependent methyltransferase [Rathayibacter sp. AY1H3]PPH10176.1 methyltransferase [Rathayibacter sp. AY1H3]
MADKDANLKYAEDAVVESEAIASARRLSVELGIDAVSPSIGAQAALVAAAARATSIIEIGTGTGVSGLWLLDGAPEAMLTSIDSEAVHQQHARAQFHEAGISPNRLRLIPGRALEVLPRMNENSYDIVFVDGDPLQVIENVEHALRLVRPGGTVLVPHALWRGRVANPAQRDEIATAFRTLVAEVCASPAVVSVLSPIGDGLLQANKRRA